MPIVGAGAAAATVLGGWSLSPVYDAARSPARTAAPAGAGPVASTADPPARARRLDPWAALGEHGLVPDEAVRAARRFASRREGTVSFAVLEPRRPPRGTGLDRAYPSASITKAMLLVAYLRQLDRSDVQLDEATRALLEPMIAYSDNAAASQVQALLEPGAIERVVKRAGMRSFGYSGDWGNAVITASDMARFFLHVDELVPTRYRDYGRRLLDRIIPEQSWGVPAAAGRRWSVLFKGGWRPTPSGALVHQGALLKRDRERLAIAVLSDGSPSHEYGTATVRGIAARLLDDDRS